MHTFVPPYSVEIVKLERKRKTNGPITYSHISHLHGLIHIWPECCMFARLISSHRILIRSFGRSFVHSLYSWYIRHYIVGVVLLFSFFFCSLFYSYFFFITVFVICSLYLVSLQDLFVFVNSFIDANECKTHSNVWVSIWMCGQVYRRMHFNIVCSQKVCGWLLLSKTS